MVDQPVTPLAVGKSGPHLPQLDSLRGLACLMVLFAHLKAVRYLHWVPDFVGDAGVGVFFVLSGFLITRILIADRAAGRSLTGFYNRRVARIFPIYFLTLAVLAATWPGKELTWAANFTFNFQFMTDSRAYFSTDATAGAVPPVAHFWSLCVEEHFYWFWPCAAMFLPRASLRFVLAAIVCATPGVTFLIAERLDSSGFSRANADGLLSRVTFTQLVAISLGGLAALHESWLTRTCGIGTRLAVPRAALVGAVLILAGALWPVAASGLSEATRRATDTTALHVLCGGLFLVALGNAPLGRFRPLARVGTISYGLYLYHLPVYAALGLTDVRAGANAFAAVAAVITTFALALFSYRFLEHPILKWAKSPRDFRPSDPRSYLAYSGKALTLAVAVLFAVGLSRAYHALTAPADPPASTPLGGDSTPDAGRPAPQSFGATVTAIVVGSSHTQMGIATPELSEVTYNLAFGGQDLWYDCAIVKAVVQRSPAVKRVYFGIDPFGVHYSIAATDGEKWRESLYFNGTGLRARIDDERRYSPLALTTAPHAQWALSTLKANMAMIDEPMRGWIPDTRAIPFDRQYGKARAESHEKLPDRMDENMACLTRTLQFCKARGVECLLVSTPTHRSYRDYFSPAYLAETTVAIQRVVQAEGVRYFAYCDNPQFVETDFTDCDHLSEAGAVKFTRLFRADLERIWQADSR